MAIFVFEGVDKSGKTTLAKAFAKRVKLPYFKNEKEQSHLLSGETHLSAKFAGVYFADLIQKVSFSAVIDRHYVSEWVYSQVLGRDFDEKVLRYIDTAFAQAGVTIIICMKGNYTTEKDEIVPQEFLNPLAEKYIEFMKWTSIKNVLLLDTTDQDVETQIRKILHYVENQLQR